MAADAGADDAERLRQLASALRTSFSQRVGALSDLLRLLCPPVRWLGTASASAASNSAQHDDSQWSTLAASQREPFVRKWIQHLQTALLDSGIVVNWADQLARDGHHDALDGWFCPGAGDAVGASVAMAGYGALLAYIGQPNAHREGVRFALRMLDRLASGHQLRSAWLACRRRSSSGLEWETAVRTLVSVPAKVANALGALSAREPRHGVEMPDSLGWQAWTDSLAVDLEALLASGGADARSLAVVVAKLARSGAFPSDAGLAASHGFWAAIMPAAQKHAGASAGSDPAYARAWSETIDALDSIELGTVIRSGLVSLTAAVTSVSGPSGDELARRVKMASSLFETVTGAVAFAEASDLLSARGFESVMSSLLSRDGWTETTAQLVVACIGSSKGTRHRCLRV